MPPIHTKLTELLGIHTPIVGAPMAGASGGALAAQTTLGGGFGFIAAGYDTPENFRSQIHLARSLLNIDEGSRLPIGVGFLGWQLEKQNSSAQELLNIVLNENIQAVWLAFGSDLGRWTKYIHTYNEQVGQDHRVTIFVQISSVDEAVVAMNEWQADVIVAQGIEAGGHGASYALPLLTLVPSILSVTPIPGPLILAAGGLATGAHVASLLTLGAAGVVLGTRFLLSPESLYTDTQRRALIAANSESSVRTMAFDYARKTLGWPRGIDGRALKNATVDDYENGVDIEIIRSKFTEAVQNDDPSRMLIWAGSGVGLMHRIQPAKEIVQELHEQCVASLQTSRAL
ncbi:2-nitropropane dioxygenase [Crucibulum laeve]|uniref:2-nitropropane dioxygenase n=1 Tax=Crucibulum laeve TaxID=68775 RepID=A0A5C3M277_9AGAR|nr:2-nitropropane dioxygenase [Crucibulum laeve]